MLESQLVTAMNAAVSLNSAPLDLGDLKDYSIQCLFSSATLGGTLQVQCSADPAQGWSDITGASQVVASGVSHMFNVIGAAYRYARLTWTASAGTGTLTALAGIKKTPITGA